MWIFKRKKKKFRHLVACCKTDPGLKRSRNEDVCLANIEKNILLVADGMGGAAGGDIASRLFLQKIIELFEVSKHTSRRQCERLVRDSFLQANSTILAHAAVNPSYAGMGCTAELLSFYGNRFVLGHVGDSRSYCFHENSLTQLTKDHSLVQQQLDGGVITADQAEKSRLRNVLLRAVGTQPNLEVDIIHGRVFPGDIIFLCTDGLHNMLAVDDIVKVLAFDMQLSMKADILVDMANEAGGSDNISVTLVEVF